MGNVGDLFIIIFFIIMSIAIDFLPIIVFVVIIRTVIKNAKQNGGAVANAERIARMRAGMNQQQGYTASYDVNSVAAKPIGGEKAQGVGAVQKVEIGSDGRPKPILG